jgi:hypothetical protein
VPIRQPNGSAHVRVLSEPSRYGARSNHHEIQPLTGWPCTKHVPFRYRFDEKPPVMVAATAATVSLGRGLTRSRRGGRGSGGRSPVKPRSNIARNLFRSETPPVFAARAKDGKDGYLAPTNAT